MSDTPKLFGADGRALHTSDEDLQQGLLGVGRQMMQQVPKDLQFCILMARKGDGKIFYYGNLSEPEMRRMLLRAKEEMAQKRLADQRRGLA